MYTQTTTFLLSINNLFTVYTLWQLNSIWTGYFLSSQHYCSGLLFNLSKTSLWNRRTKSEFLGEWRCLKSSLLPFYVRLHVFTKSLSYILNRNQKIGTYRSMSNVKQWSIETAEAFRKSPSFRVAFCSLYLCFPHFPYRISCLWCRPNLPLKSHTRELAIQ